MTPIDRFERQLPTALTDLADPRTPDYLIDILGQTARTRQRPAWASLERWLPMDVPSTTRSGRAGRWRLLGALAVLAALIILVVGAFALTGGSQRSDLAPAVVPPATPEASASASATAKAGPMPADVVGVWQADVHEIAGIKQGATTQFILGDPADTLEPAFLLDVVGSRPILPGNVDEVEPGILRIVSKEDFNACPKGSAGRYRWAKPAPDVLTLELVSDACPVRGETIAGTWQRSIDRGFKGSGTGVLGAFKPLVQVTLPDDTYTGIGNGGYDEAIVEGADGKFTLKAWKDLDGFADPCDIAKGRVTLDPGIDGFLAYLQDSKGLTVTDTQEMTIDGRRAVRVDITTADGITAPCFDGGVLQWMPHAAPDGDWHLTIGDPDTVFVTEVDGATIVLEIAAAGDGQSNLERGYVIPQDVLDSIHFLDSMPDPGA